MKPSRSEPISKDLVGYVDPLSVRAGDTLSVFVSCERAGDYNASLVQLVSGDARPHGTGFREIAVAASFAGTYAGVHQPLMQGSYAVLPDLPESRALTFACYFYPTLLESIEQTLAHCVGFSVGISSFGLNVVVADERIDVSVALRAHRWHRLVVSVDEQLRVRVDCLPQGPSERAVTFATTRDVRSCRIPGGDWELARRAPGRGHFNGRIESVRIYGAAIEATAAIIDLDLARPNRPGLSGAWDFSLGIETTVLFDVSGHNRHGSVQQMPTRAVRGAKWRGDVFNWQEDPSQYAAIHFHDDDLVDAQWSPSITWQIPDDLTSGVYAVKLTRQVGEDEGSEDYVPFFVRPAAHHRHGTDRATGGDRNIYRIRQSAPDLFRRHHGAPQTFERQ